MTIEQMRENGTYEYYAWPGGYEIFYICADGGILCANCANENFELTLDPDDDQWFIIACEVNYEDNGLYCDHCNRRIEPEYGDD